MAIVNERHTQAKPIQVDPKTGKPMPGPATPARTASPTNQYDPMNGDQNGGFFGSFFASKNKKKMAAMEAPPPMLKASGTLSEREGVEVEVISKSTCNPENHFILLTLTELLINSYYNIVKRTMIDMVPKAIMLNLVQYVLRNPHSNAKLTPPGSRKMRCSANFLKTCTEPTLLTTY